MGFNFDISLQQKIPLQYEGDSFYITFKNAIS